MDSLDISSIHQLTTEHLWLLAQSWAPEDWKREINKLNPDQILAVLPAASEEQDPSLWKEKTQAIIEGLVHPSKLEAAGRILTLPQIMEMITLAATTHNALEDKLFPLFIGMPHHNFLHLLLQATPVQIALLKKESITEPVQHHLTLIVQELNAEIAKKGIAFTSLQAEIEALDLADIETQGIHEEENKIKQLQEECLLIQFKVIRLLELAWNTNRGDLIDKLSKLKEQIQKFIKISLGEPLQEPNEATGLYALLKKHLDKAFDNSNNPETNYLSNEQEPIIEALVRFSVWYLRDYWEIGLLPNQTEISDLELNPEKFTEQERLDRRESLFAMAEKNLHSMGLVTLRDLKTAKIYSKKALQDFIRKHQNNS